MGPAPKNVGLRLW